MEVFTNFVSYYIIMARKEREFVNMKVIKGFKIRIYPNKNQRILIEKHFGCCRKIWNIMLNLQNHNYKKENKYLSGYEMINLLPNLKKQSEYQYLQEVSIKSLQEVCRDLDKSFRGCFNKISKFPKFKSKKFSKKSYPVCSGRFYFKTARLLQIQKLGNVKFKTDFNFNIGKTYEGKFKNVRLSKEGNKYYVSFSLEIESQEKELNDYKLGIDLGIKEQAVCFCNDKSYFFSNINKDEKMKKLFNEVKLLQRSISRKYLQNKQGNKFIKTKNILREEEKLRKLNKKISNIRRNYIHQITRSLVNLLPQEIIIETLNVKGMLKNHTLAKYIQQQNFFIFKQILKYKAEWLNIKFTEVDRWYPSSKTCSKCGNIKKGLTLNDREYICEKCNLVIDRDLNAAINLVNYVAN